MHPLILSIQVFKINEHKYIYFFNESIFFFREVLNSPRRFAVFKSILILYNYFKTNVLSHISLKVILLTNKHPFKDVKKKV